MNIPSDINIEELSGIARNEHPASYFRDEIIWSPQEKYFALAHSITEITMGNYVGGILWGEYDGTSSTILGITKNIGACCWRQPWCRWLDEKSFIFKAQKYDEKTTHTPLVMIHIEKGFSVLPGSDNKEKWIDEVVEYNGTYQNYDEQLLIKAVINTQEN